MTHYVNVSGRTQTQPDGQDWAPLAAFEWSAEAVAHLIAYRYVLPLAAPVDALPEPAPSPEAVQGEQAPPPEAEAPENAPPPREAAISSAPRKRGTPPKEDSL